ncbi:MAG: cyclic pyranopterin monophosphate synthase MoaC [Thaumarchaeota archaeon]|jgi:cyclic pyranopterin phosphate synthase|nr:cyclic pyranopterin monophosphate synthase MoaC [Candidatus Wolframiiraptor allenii]
MSFGLDMAEIRQVDVSGKEVVRREAVARGFIKLRPETIQRIRSGALEKGDPLQVARLAGINAAKLTPFLLPLCHPLKLEHVEASLNVMDDGVEVMVRVVAHEKTGVEMEALTAAAIALLNIWDVVKQYEKDESGQYPLTEITSIRVLRKVKEG